MHKSLLVILILSLIAAASCSYAFTVQDVVNQISSASLQDYMTNTLPTHSQDNRAFNMGTSNHVIQHGAQHDLAAENIYTGLRRSGWTTMYDPFTFNDDSGNAWTGKNVVAVKQGTTRPDDIYIIGAHYDSIANRDSNPAYAPGGDDNGSGVAGLLEMARALAPYDFDATIVFAAFDGEEVTATVSGTAIHRLGSMHYAAEHSDDNIVRMISLDMMAWQDPAHPNIARLETGYSQNAALNSEISGALRTYGGLGIYTNNSMNYSDHVSFANEGIPALMIIENNWPNNPNYHRQTDSTDTPNYINYGYATNIVKGVTGFLATYAGVEDGYSSAPTQVVPEPGSIMVLLAGIAGIPAIMRRRVR